jgi:hypothetical protein
MAGLERSVKRAVPVFRPYGMPPRLAIKRRIEREKVRKGLYRPPVRDERGPLRLHTEKLRGD